MNHVTSLLATGWFGSAVGLLGLILAVIFYLKSQRSAALAYQVDEVSLLGGSDAAFPAEVEVRFNGIPVPQITASRVFLWNAGQRTISGEEIVHTDPLRIEFAPGTQVLKCVTAKVARAVNGIAASAHPDLPSIVEVTFDFLDPNDGVALEILHSGPRRRLAVVGTIRGIPRGITNHGRALWMAVRRNRTAPFPFSHPRVLFAITIMFGLGVALSGLFRPQIARAFPGLFTPPEPDRLDRPNWAFVLVGISYALLPAYLLWTRRRKYPIALEPEDESDDTQTITTAAT